MFCFKEIFTKVAQLDEHLKKKKKYELQIPTQPKVGGPFSVGNRAVAKHLHTSFFFLSFFRRRRRRTGLPDATVTIPSPYIHRIRFMLH